MNVARFFRRSLKRSTNIVRRVGRSTRSLAGSALRRGEGVVRTIGRTARRVERRGEGVVRRIGRTTRRTLRLKRRQ